jgi:hypothetical protein
MLKRFHFKNSFIKGINMGKNIKIALLGVCNSRNLFNYASKNNDIIIDPFIFTPCFLDITKDGLNIPKKFFEILPSKPFRVETASFTRKNMWLDLNKMALYTVQSNNFDYLIIDLSSLIMDTYEIEYKNKKVFSCNAYSPLCYKYLQKVIPNLHFQQIKVSKEFILSSLKELAEYLKSNFDLSKIIIFDFTCPDYYLGPDKKIYKYPESIFCGKKEVGLLREYTEFLSKLLPTVRVFEDSEIKLATFSEGEKPTPVYRMPYIFHVDKNTQKLQGYLFRKFIFNEDCNNEIEELKLKISEEIKSKLL